jgi:hypothetical protein
MKKKIGITLKNKRVSDLTLHKYGPSIVYQEQADIVEW